MGFMSAVRDFIRGMMDERFILHRYKATRFALVAGVIAIGALFYYEFFVQHRINWSLMIVLGVMAVSKVIAMTYYRITN